MVERCAATGRQTKCDEEMGGFASDAGDCDEMTIHGHHIERFALYVQLHIEFGFDGGRIYGLNVQMDNINQWSAQNFFLC